ncbi:MAG: response regulator transcription factor [Rhodoferax sp.]|jgi:DNA-binding NarL/FixJ family response regulator|nr:response regulator transcription factor [Rhodoferax sp.]
MIRLLIADDHAIVRDGLKRIFAAEPDLQVVGEAVNGDGVLAWLAQDGCDLILLDLNIPGISGAELIACIKKDVNAYPILVLTMHNEPSIAARMLKAGADGYITKDCESDVLLSAIRTVAAHGKYIAPEIASKLALEMTSAQAGAPHQSLSERELQVLRLLIAGDGLNDIAARLSISNKTVSTHKTRVMEKLKLSNMAELMRYAMQHRLLE